jgi:MFS family permease
MVAGAIDENEPLLRANIERSNTDTGGISVKNPQHDPQQLPTPYKWAIVALMAVMNVFVTFNCIGMVPVSNRVVEELSGRHSRSASILLVTVWELGEAAGPLLIGPLSEAYGRYPVINVANVFFIAFTVLAAATESAPLFIAARFMTGVAVTVNVLNPAIVGDLFRPDQRGSPMSLVQLAPLIGGASGPAISGAIAETLGWRYILWISAGLTTACELVFLLCYKETYKPVILRQLEKDEARKAHQHSAAPLESANHKAAGKLFDSVKRPALVFRSSGVLMAMAFFGSVVFAQYYIVCTTLPGVMEEIHGLPPTLTGMTLIANSFGSSLGVLLCNMSLDKVYVRLRDANGGVDRPEYRLPLCIFGGLLLPVAVAAYGWLIELRAAIPILLVFVAIHGAALMLCILPLATYIVDAFGAYSASALTVAIIARCLMGTFLPLTVPPLVDGMGWGWGLTVMALFTLCLAPIPWAVSRYGEQWRMRSKYSRNI